MSLESFYGGKQGVSPVVRARFKYVDTNDAAYKSAIKNKTSEEIASINKDTMEWCFANVNYEDVWYGQLAIIDTKNKRNPNNGKLFRRVLTRTSDEATVDGGTLHGEYIGRIIGPSEGYPKIRLGSKESILNQIGKENNNKEKGAIEYSFPVGENEIVDTDNFDEVAPVDLIASVENNQLIPGYNSETGAFEKGIHYSWVNVRNNIDGEDQETYTYLGFTIPTTYLDIDITGVNWKDSFSATQTNEEEYQNGIQPFYQHWDIQIPRGVQGNSVGFLRRAKLDDFRNLNEDDTTKPILYPYSDIYNEEDGTFNPRDYDLSPISGEHKYPQFDKEGLNKDSSILVYTLYLYDTSYDESDKRKVVNCYLSAVMDIERVDLQDDGSFSVYYSSGAIKTWEKKIKWIESIDMSASNADEGEEYPIKDTLTITYNNGDKEVFDSLRFLENLQLYRDYEQKYKRLRALYTNSPIWQDIGDFYFYQLDGLYVDPLTKELKYHTDPVNAPLTAPHVDYRSFDEPVILNSVEDIFLDPQDGYGYIKFSSSEKRYTGTQTMTEPYLPYARDIYVEENSNQNWPKGTWKRGGNFPDAVIAEGETESDARQKWAWWYELGLIRRDLISGVKFAADFNKERYLAYYNKIHPGEVPQLDGLTEQEVLNILQDEWNIVEDGVTYSTSPYLHGNIFIYELGDNTNLINPKIAENKRGQLIYFDGKAYYYDNNNSQDGARWKYAGDWNSSNQTMQIKIKTNAGALIPEEIEPLDKGFTLLEEQVVQEDSMPWENIWRGIGE